MDQLPDLAPLERRSDELDAQMASPSFYANPRKAAEISREQQKLRQLIVEYREHGRLERETRRGPRRSLKDHSAGDARCSRNWPQPNCRSCNAGAHTVKNESVLLAMIPPGKP